ncbi:MAG: hypothetical protein Q4G46_00930 [Propionibacteriaceae bacterium]|nr:hypothetical protein [Propionibacteriaceae bacterium]
MKTPLLPALALAAVLAVSACGSPNAAPQEAPRTAAAPADTGILPPQTAEPSPDPSTPAPSGAVTEANLPDAQDLHWNDGASWRAAATTTGGGTEQLSVCQQNSMESLGANAILVRTFTFTGNGDAVAVAMSFDSRAGAEEAYAVAQEWMADCQGVLVAQKRTNGSQGIPPTPVALPQSTAGKAQVTEWGYRTASTDPANLEFESQGLAQVNDRLALVFMRSEGQDSNWDLSPGGPVGSVHPMIRSLPAVAAKLTR